MTEVNVSFPPPGSPPATPSTVAVPPASEPAPVPPPQPRKEKRPRVKVTEHVPIVAPIEPILPKSAIEPIPIVFPSPAPKEALEKSIQPDDPMKGTLQEAPPHFIKQREQPKIPTIQKLRDARIQRGLEIDEARLLEEEEEKRKAARREILQLVAAGAVVFGLVFFGSKLLYWAVSSAQSSMSKKPNDEVPPAPPAPVSKPLPKKKYAASSKMELSDEL